MYKKAFTIMTVVGVLGLTGATLVYASQPHNPITGPTTVQFMAKTNMQHFMNHPPRNLNIGDGFAFHDQIKQGGNWIGADGGTCTWTQLRLSHQAGSLLCNVTFALPKGQVNVQGLLNFNNSGPTRAFGINGGTGAYRAARGIAVLDFTKRNLRVTLELLP
jgi:hypothetical protein